MIGIFMMQAMAIHPGDRIYVDPEDVVNDSDAFYEPFLIVERAMRDSHMQNIGQIQPGKKPTEGEINSADQQSSPRSQVSRGGIHTSQQVAENNQIPSDVVDFHELPVVVFKQKSEPFQIAD